MDPFIEGHEWQNFHVSMVLTIRDMLVPVLRPRYVVRPEERVYLEKEFGDDDAQIVIPDVLLADSLPQPSRPGARGGATATVQPAPLTLPFSQPAKRRFLTIRQRENLHVVTVIEVLSPTNKSTASKDRGVYLAKREEVIQSNTSLVELYLLRGGRRVPFREPLPRADFLAFICRANDWPHASAYPWTLRQALPKMPIPLAEGDEDVMLDLQEAFTLVYDRAGYDYSLDYSAPIEPPLSPEDSAWVDEILKGRQPA